MQGMGIDESDISDVPTSGSKKKPEKRQENNVHKTATGQTPGQSSGKQESAETAAANKEKKEKGKCSRI